MKIFWQIVMIVSGVCLIAIFVIGMRKTSTMVKGVKAASDNELPLTQVITHEDSALISPKYIGRVRSHQNVNSKVMDPVSFLYVDDTYHLVIFKINMETDQPFKEILSSDIANSKRSDKETYSMVDFNGFSQFEWRPAPTMRTRNIFLSLYGDSVSNEILNDSIASYHLLCKNLSIKYEKNGIVQVFMTGREITPSDVLFLKRDKIVYFMLMTPAKPDSFIPREILYDLIMGR
ncbi:MAG TPA: hypothetical protein VGM30_12650 [Puia sp.]|jgi:hypothetical protein